jgi:hypothetical protein
MSMFDLTQLSDDALRAALFDALVARLDALVLEDPSVGVVNRMPTVLTVSRQGNLLTLSQGLGLLLLRGVLKRKDRRETVKTFNVGRATIQSRLVITPDRIAGTPDQVLDWIVKTLLEQTATGEQSGPAVAAAVQENRATAPVPPTRPTPRDATHERRATAAAAKQERRPATVRTTRESRPPVAVTPSTAASSDDSSPRPQTAAKPSEAEAARPRPALRTYQLLLETAQHELKVAKALPVDRRKYFLISGGVCVALSAEAFLNDLGSRVISSWGQLQRLDPREKAEVLNIEMFKEKVDWSVGPFQSVAAALGFRRALAHAHAETLGVDQIRPGEQSGSEVPRTRRTAWQEHCEVATIQRWINDLRLLIEHFSRSVDPTAAAAGGRTKQVEATKVAAL